MLSSVSFTKSQNTGTNDLFRQFLVPSTLQTVVYLLIGMMLLVLIKARDIWESLGGNIILKDGGVLVDTPLSRNIWSDISGSVLPQVAFWGVMGMIMYGVIWFIWNVLTNLRNDMAADEFVHPKTYDRSKYWLTVLARKGFFGAFLVLFAVYVFVLYKFLPVLADVSYSAIATYSFPDSIIGLAVYLPVIAVLIHIFVLMIRVAANAWQSIYKDL